MNGLKEKITLQLTDNQQLIIIMFTVDVILNVNV
jgi:hypothetical protein